MRPGLFLNRRRRVCAGVEHSSRINYSREIPIEKYDAANGNKSGIILHLLVKRISRGKLCCGIDQTGGTWIGTTAAAAGLMTYDE